MNLEDIVVKVKADISDFQKGMADADKAFGPLQAKGNETAKSLGAVEKALGSGHAELRKYAAEMRAAFGPNEQLTRSQVSMINALQDEVVARRLSGRELATYTALRRSNTAADSEAGIVIRRLVAAQHESVGVTGGWRTALVGATGAMGANAAAARVMAAEHRGASAATVLLRDTMRTVGPIAASMGGSFGVLGSMVGASKVGLAGLAIAAGGSLVVGLALAGDESVKLTKKFTDLFGSESNGRKVTGELEESARRLGTTMGAVADPIQALTDRLRELNRLRGIVMAPGADQMPAEYTKAAAAASTLNNFLQADIQDSKTLTTVTKALWSEMITGGGLTLETFQKLRGVSVATSDAIAKAFGEDFLGMLVRLRQGPIELEKFVDQLKRLGPESERALIDAPKTSAGMFDRLWSSLERMVKKAGELSETGPAVRSALSGMEDGVNSFIRAMNEAGGTSAGFRNQVIKAHAEALIGVESFASQWPQIIAGGASAALGIISSWGSAAASIIAGALKGFSATGGASGSSGPYQIPTAGPLGGYDNPFANTPYPSGSSEAMSTGGLTYPTGELIDWSGLQFSGEGFALGTRGVRTVPDGFPGDSYNVRLTSGEQFAVAPRGQSLRNVIDLGGFADGTAPDMAITPQGGAILSLTSKFSGVFDDLGLTMRDVRETVSAAGNNKLNDVVRLGTIQTVGAINIAENKITAQLNSTCSQIVAAINASAITVSNATNVAASSSAGAIGNVLSGGPGGVVSGGGGGGGGSRRSGPEVMSQDFHISTTSPFEAGMPVSSAPNWKMPSWGSDPFSQGRRSETRTAGGGLPGFSTSDLSNPMNIGGLSDYAAGFQDPGFDFSGDFANPGEFTVPQKFKDDSFRAQLNLSGGETVSVKRYGSGGGDDASASRGGGMRSVTINIYYPQDGASVLRSLPQIREKASREFDMALRRR